MNKANFPNGFKYGATIRDLNILNTYAGKVFHVDSGHPLANNNPYPAGGTETRPFSTLDYAIGQCTANNGDIIVMSPGHAETVSTASGITADVAGVAILGLGQGADRPTFTFSATAATIVVSAASVTMQNFITKPSIDSVVSPIVVSGADCYLDFEHQDDSSTIEAVRAVLTTATADNLSVNLKYSGFVAGNAVVNAVRLVGVNNAKINVDFYGVASTSVVEFLTTACTNVNVTGYVYNSGTTDGSKLVVDTVTGSTWFASINDGAAGATFTGGSGAALAADDVSAVSSALSTLQAEVSGAAGIASFPSGAAAANAVSLAEVIRYIQENVIVGSGTALPANSSLYGVLAGATGIATYPTAAAAGNNVSMAEVLRYIQDRVTALSLNRNSTNYFAVTADFTSATWNTAAAHEILTVTGACRIIILPQVTATPTSAGSAATLVLGDETTTNSLITSTDAENLATAEWWFDATDTRTLAKKSVFENLDFVVAGGKDIGYTIGTEALTGGSIVFHVWWEPIDATGAVAAGAGGAL